MAGQAPSFIGLLASRRRAESVLGVLAQAGVDAQRLAAIRNPVGIDIGARSAPDVAVSILAEIIAHSPAEALESPTLATDVVCGMDVEIAGAHQAEHLGQTFFFCCAGCQAAFVANPGAYLVAEHH